MFDQFDIYIDNRIETWREYREYRDVIFHRNVSHTHGSLPDLGETL